MKPENLGVILGLFFCFISAAFDVYVAFITQVLDTLVVVFYCFVSSAALFMMYSLRVGRHSLMDKIQQDWPLVVWINLSVLLNWGGLFYALRFLEPAVVGVASVACGPALTLLVSSFVKGAGKATALETLIAGLVLLSVAIMLFQSLVGESGISSTSIEQRIIGIVSVVLCAMGTVFYTIVSKKMFYCRWKTYDILAVRSVMMVVVCSLFISFSDTSFSLAPQWILPLSVLVVVGHLLPVYLIQKTIFHLSPIAVSFVLLTLPVFTLLLQYLDSRVAISMPSILAVCLIVVLLAWLDISNRRGAK
ncbi:MULTISPECIES: DMT family transporter [Pseudomonas]|uniref:DMT family transporter n=1 Tax=Pseudomonas TaxID=286 RepID=UPI000E819C3E|nr:MULTISPECIES: DMT family transporter [Pseudomonas]HBP46947.1 transporter [Pseudomonas sp.]